jgi:phthiodiolone/phenolphthiodiolone dimycocerosates ketoreductase
MSSFGVGYLEQLVNTRISPTALIRSSYAMAAAAGIETYWLPDHLNNLIPRAIATPEYLGATRLAPDVDAYLEPWTMLGRIAGWNRLGRLRLGVAVTDTGRRNPAVTAQAAATLHLLTRGRAILGIGVGEREGNEPYGVDWTKPVARFEEALATIRALWNSKGELVTRESAIFPLRNAIFALPPYRGKWPEIWVASHGPRMLRATGRYADAWFPATVMRPQDYAERLEIVRAAASDAGRDPFSIRPAIALILVTGRSRDAVDEAIGSPAVRSMALCVPDSEWARHGAQHPMGRGFSGLQDILPQVLDQETVLKYNAQVPQSLLREVTLNGTPEEIIDQAAEWRDHGVSHAMLLNLSGLQPSLRKSLATNLPTLKVLRGLKKL